VWLLCFRCMTQLSPTLPTKASYVTSGVVGVAENTARGPEAANRLSEISSHLVMCSIGGVARIVSYLVTGTLSRPRGLHTAVMLV